MNVYNTFIFYYRTAHAFYLFLAHTYSFSYFLVPSSYTLLQRHPERQTTLAPSSYISLPELLFSSPSEICPLTPGSIGRSLSFPLIFPRLRQSSSGNCGLGRLPRHFFGLLHKIIRQYIMDHFKQQIISSSVLRNLEYYSTCANPPGRYLS